MIFSTRIIQYKFKHIFFVHFQLSLAAYLRNNPQSVVDATGVDIYENLVTYLSDSHNDIAYTKFCKFFDAAYENKDVMQISKETYSYQVKCQSFKIFIFL